MELLLPGELRAELEAPVRAIVPQVVIRWYTPEFAVDGPTVAVDGIFRWSIPNDQLRAFMLAAPNLRWLHVARAGVDGPLLAMVRDRPVLLSNSAGMHAVPIGEYVLWAMLAQATVTVQAAGGLVGGLSFGYEKFICDVEALQVMAELARPAPADADSLAFEAMAEVPPGGHFFATSHTMDRYQTAFYSPLVADLSNHGAWTEAGAQSSD